MVTKVGDWHFDAHCPRCRSLEAQLQCALRSSAVYLCRDCEHEWEVEAGLTDSSEPHAVTASSR